MAEANEPVEPQGGDGGKEPETDWKAEARKWERRAVRAKKPWEGSVWRFPAHL